MDYDYDSYLEYMTCENDDYYNLDNEEFCPNDYIDNSDTELSIEDTEVKFDK